MEFLPKQHWQCTPKSIEYCCYLGSKLYLTPVTESHVMKRPANTRAASQRLNHCIWNEKFIRLQTKLYVYHTTVLTVLAECLQKSVCNHHTKPFGQFHMEGVPVLSLAVWESGWALGWCLRALSNFWPSKQCSCRLGYAGLGTQYTLDN